MVKYIAILFFVMLQFKFAAQNLIPNPGFEQIDKHGIIDWESTAWTPDFYHLEKDKGTYYNITCGESIGKGFLGIGLCGEVTSTKMMTSLEKGKEYFIKIHAQKPQSFCPGGIKKITVAFSQNKLPHKEGPSTSFYPIPFVNLYPSDFKPLKEKCKWVEFSTIYTATGNENYIHIGDFRKVYNSPKMDPVNEIIYIDSLESSTCYYIHCDSIVVEKISTGEENSMILEGIHFENNKSNLLPQSYESLDKLYGLVYKLRNYKIKISGHTDNVGDKNKNLTLSKQRAESVVNYLIKKGISKNRLIASGYGDTKPIANNDTEEGKIKNRRVEIELLK